MANRVDHRTQGVHFCVSGSPFFWRMSDNADMLISSIGSCGSYLDGGASHAFQEAAVPMLEPTLVHNEMIHLQKHFRVCKRCSRALGARHSDLFTGQARLRRTTPSRDGLRHQICS